MAVKQTCEGIRGRSMDPDRFHSEDNRRRRSALACNTCRSRRTKCDGQRPRCSFCTARGRDCSYEESQNLPPSPLKGELAKLWEQLDHLTAVVRGQQHSTRGLRKDAFPPAHAASRKFPYMIIQSEAFMSFLGLDSSLPERLEHLERGLQITRTESSTPRIVLIDIHDASILLDAFTEHILTWYPILHVGFTDDFILAVTSGFPTSVQSCLALLVLAIGCVVECEYLVEARNRHPEELYIEAAMGMLPCVLADSSPQSAQCLLLFAVYHLCHARPFQAHDNIAMASFRLQEYLMNHAGTAHDPERMSIAGNCFWSAQINKPERLNTYSEILVQLDLVHSGVWNITAFAPAPTSSNSWLWPVSPPSESPTPSPSDSGLYSPSAELSYFVAEVAMRKMLQRCTWATSTLNQGGHIYAPIVAAELERQLNQWHQLLPEPISFGISLEHVGSGPRRHPNSAQVAFLRAQYYAFKVSIYWPAVYEALTVGDASENLLGDCGMFFSSYAEFVPSAAAAVAVCKPNLWTLCASVFTISMAALAGLAEPCLLEVVSQGVVEGLELATRVFDGVTEVSPSLAEMGSILHERMHFYNTS
ncbi:hypothetical protein BJY01DRAFT_260581 [Aspergillus pseudoustus]|uniref:Zn(2)-C6 fungal-type domain-containing protein n=1 Tax=Aspergillus pseudoustus TaxID=1810923 RepID=A0ABR4IUN0_9EURO